jgi:hypothetical protein
MPLCAGNERGASDLTHASIGDPPVTPQGMVRMKLRPPGKRRGKLFTDWLQQA